MLRDLDGLAGDVGAWFASGQGSEGAVVAALGQEPDTLADGDDTDGAGATDERIGAVLVALKDNFMAALAVAMLALERGDEALLSLARERLRAASGRPASSSSCPPGGVTAWRSICWVRNR